MYKSVIIGHIGQDATYKDFNGTRFISFSVAHSERFKDANGETVERTTWFSCLKRGESKIIEYLKKGTLIYLEGSPTHRIYEQNGKPQIGNNLNVLRIELLSARNNQDNPATDQPPAQADNDDLPF